MSQPAVAPATSVRLHQAAEREALRFDSVTIALHWTTLALILALFASAWLYGQSADENQAGQVLAVHRSMGVALWGVTLGRLGWRRRFGATPALPPAMPRLQQQLAKANEFCLYAVLLIQPLTGIAQSLARGRPFPVFGLMVPKLMARRHDVVTVFQGVHEATAWALVGMIGAHAMAALFHRFVLRDRVMQSMWPQKILASGNKPARPPV